MKTSVLCQLVRLGLCASLALTSPLLLAQQSKNALPNIGNAAVSTLSIEKEKIYGNAMLKQIRASQPVLHDPVLTEYINELGNNLVKHADNVNYKFNFFLIDNKVINAFAFFGGNVGVHSGLVALADEESELASVLAHEISHVTQRHLARKLEANKQGSTLTTAGLLSGVLLALVNPQLGLATLTTTMAASQQAGINYTRINEKEADRVGMQLLANSGYNPASAAQFFGKLADKYRYASKPPAMLLTHPLPESRIADVRTRAQQYPVKPLPPSLSFELAKARIKARYEGTPADNITLFNAQLTAQQYKIQQAALYGLAIAHFEHGDYQQAEQILVELLNDDKTNLFYVDVLADVYVKLAKFDQGLAMLGQLNQLMPQNQVVTLNYANVAMEAGQFELAINLVSDFILLQPDHFLARDLLSQLYQRAQKLDQYHSAKAEVFALLGIYDRAIDELQTAFKHTNENILAQKRIKARITQFQEQKEQLERL